MGYTPSFTPQYENGWEDLPSETSPITAEALNAYDDAIENIEEYLASDESQANLADAYDETATYEAGDYVIYGGDLYKCLEDIDEPEEWDSTKWESCSITNEMGHGGGGSNVSITPTLSTGTKIADFEIDGQTGELYAPTGGGGSANIWTGTQAELEEVFDELEEGTQINITDDEQEVVEGGTIYSEDEQVIGLWTDNRPLYQRTVNVTGLSKATTSTIAISASNLANLGIVTGEIHDTEFVLSYGAGGSENLFSQNIYLNSTNLIIVWTAGGNIYYQAQWGSAATADIGITFTFKYTKSTDAPLDVVVGKSTMYIASSDCYSTEEKEVGVFADGKPLYQKTIYTSGGNLTNGQIIISNDLANIEHIASWKCVTHDVTHDRDYCLNHNRFDATEDVKFQTYIGSDNTVALVILVSKTTFMTAIGDTWITLQYTKTTDTAGSGSYTPASGKAVHYSTDEQVIGTYVDGKPIYRKSFTYSSGSLSTGQLTLANGLSSVARVIDKHCQIHGGADDRDYDIPYFRTDYNESVFLLCHVLTDNTVATVLMSNDHSSYNNLTNIVVTLEYTKTTD